MARESQVQRERRQVVGVAKFDERSREAKLREVSVKGDAFDAPERIGEIRR
jgi:hypothetical protein